MNLAYLLIPLSLGALVPFCGYLQGLKRISAYESIFHKACNLPLYLNHRFCKVCERRSP